MSLFGADQVYTCLEKVYMVYTGLPPDDIDLADCGSSYAIILNLFFDVRFSASNVVT